MKYNIIYFILALILTKYGVKKILFLLEEGNAMGTNYKKEKIPVSSGIFFIPIIIIMSIIIIIIEGTNCLLPISTMLIGTISMAFLGLCDDLLGNRNITGLKGHLLYILRGKLSTGGLKAVVGGLVALIISLLISRNSINIIINTLIIALSTNFINLLDLRPGRALKGFILCAILAFVYPINEIIKSYICILYGAVLGYINYDLKAKAMLGDVGSNLIGVSLGILWAYNTNLNLKLWALIFLIGIHVFAEKYSITKTIDKVWVLKYLDNLGR